MEIHPNPFFVPGAPEQITPLVLPAPMDASIPGTVPFHRVRWDLRVRTRAVRQATRCARLVMLACLLGAPLFAAPEYPRMGPDIFDPKVPAKQLIAQAITRATAEDKRILLLFGTNWCPWCRRLHRVFEEDVRVVARLRQYFVLAYIDANTRHDKARNRTVIEQYGNPLRHGIPVFVVLDAKGTLLATRETSSLSAPTDRGVADKLLAFLAEWSGGGVSRSPLAPTDFPPSNSGL